MSSRLVALGIFWLDAMATLLTLAHCSATLLVIVVSLVTSLAMAMFSSMVRSVIWPTYFWQQTPHSRSIFH